MRRGLIGVLLTVMLTARMGVYRNPVTGYTETWYNLPMQNVINRAAAQGIVGDYWERADHMKMYGKYIILAAHESIPIGTVIETSRGTGIVLDRTQADKDVIDIAVTWR